MDNLVLGPTPWIFREDVAAYNEWRGELRLRSHVKDTEPHIVGSAAVGFSLSPNKPGRAFRQTGQVDVEPSDIDLAIVSAELFQDCWNEVLRYDRRKALPRSHEELIHLRQGIYFGHVPNDLVPAATRPAQVLVDILATSSRSTPLRGHPMSAWIYRRLEDLREYQVRSVTSLRMELNRGAP